MTRWLVAALLGVTLLAACGSDDADEPTAEGQTEIALTAQSGSGQSGEAVLSEVDASTTRVEITLANPPAEPQPAHIHRGDCEDLEPQPEYPLESVADGKSTTEVNAKLDDLLGGGFAINVHESELQVDMYVACGELSASPGAEPATTTEDSERDY